MRFARFKGEGGSDIAVNPQRVFIVEEAGYPPRGYVTLVSAEGRDWIVRGQLEDVIRELNQALSGAS